MVRSRPGVASEVRRRQQHGPDQYASAHEHNVDIPFGLPENFPLQTGQRSLDARDTRGSASFVTKGVSEQAPLKAEKTRFEKLLEEGKRK